MPTIYAHEIAAYRVDLQSIGPRFHEISAGNVTKNLTHATLAASNRSNLILVGLCGLVEAWLFELAMRDHGPFQLSDIRGQGVRKLQLFLSRTEVIDFSRLKHWERFQNIYAIRNAIVHSYGGLVGKEESKKFDEALSYLGLQDSLVGGRRIRLGPTELQVLLDIIDDLLGELGAYAT